MSSSDGDLMRVRVSLDAGGSVIVEHVSGVEDGNPFVGWHHLTFAVDWTEDELVFWLQHNARRSAAEYMQWSYGVNAISLAPIYRVEVLHG